MYYKLAYINLLYTIIYAFYKWNDIFTFGTSIFLLFTDSSLLIVSLYITKIRFDKFLTKFASYWKQPVVLVLSSSASFVAILVE